MTRRSAWGLFAGVLACYAVTSSYVATEGDPAGEVQDLLTAPGANLRPNHLLQTALNRVAHTAFRAAGFEGADFIPPQVVSNVLGAVSAVLLLAFLLRLGVTAGLAWALTGVFVVSWAPWFHSRTAETGMTPLPALLGALLLLLPASPPTRRAALARAAGAGALLGVAALLSLYFVLLLPTLIWLATGLAGSRRERWATALACGLATLVVTGGPYLAGAWAAGVDSPRSFVGWLTTHPVQAEVALGSRGIFGALRAVTGVGRLVFAYSHGETAVKAVLKGVAVDVAPAEWLSLARNLAATAVLLLAVPLAWRRRRDRLAAGPGLLAVGLTLLVATRWQGSDPQFWLPVYPFLLAAVADLTAGWWQRTGRRTRTLVVGAVLLWLGLSNLPIWTPTPLYPRYDERWTRLFLARDALPSRALVLSPGQSVLFGVQPLRPDVEVLDIVLGAPRGLQREAYGAWLTGVIDTATAAGRAVYLEGLRVPFRPELLQPWDMLADQRDLDRAALAALLDARYRWQPADELWPGVERLVPR